MSEPIFSLGLGGGVWRLKWHPHAENADFLLAACMHNGFRVVKANSAGFEAEPTATSDCHCAEVGYYMDHKSLAYGADWCHSRERRDSFLVGSCSFYDCSQHMWQLNTPLK